MPYLVEIKLAGVVLAVVLTYLYLIRPRLNAKKQKILERYLYVQSFSLNMQDLLLKYILQNDAMGQNLMPGVTYKAYLRDLQKKHSKYLSEKKYKNIKQNIVLLFTVWISRVLDRQEERLHNVQKELLNIQKELNRKTQREAVAN